MQQSCFMPSVVYSKLNIKNLILGELQFSTEIMDCDIIFTWTGALTNITEVLINQYDGKQGWIIINNSSIRVKNALSYTSIKIDVRVYKEKLRMKPFNDTTYKYNGMLRPFSYLKHL